MSKGKGGQTTTEVKIPKALRQGSKDAIAGAKAVGGVGYIPYEGPTVAAFTPAQEASFANTDAAATAFGLPGSSTIGRGAGLPEPATYAGGVGGYSAFPLFEEAWGKVDPDQKARLADAVKTITGSRGDRGSAVAPQGATGGSGIRGKGGSNKGGAR